MKISIIVAVSKNQVIGVENQLPWHLPADLKYFKAITLGHTIIMGRTTFESIGRPLPKRENIVISRNTAFNHEGIVLTHSIEEALNYCKEQQYEEVFIIGGDTIYQQTVAFSDRIYLTRVDTIVEKGSAFFPDLDDDEWKLVSSTSVQKDEHNNFDFSFEIYDKVDS